MQPYLTPICSVEPVVTLQVAGLVGINWLTIVAVVLVTAGQTMIRPTN